jgi:thioredoxin reductase/bacterioferritin-associated ferredoxin
MKTHYELVIIGDGPAGMAAAINAAKHGLSVLMIGEQQRPGGQIYRNIEATDPDLMNILGPDYAKGKSLLRRFQTAGVDYLHGTVVWQVQAEPEFVVSYISDHEARQVRATRVIIATGARERPMPIPGWTLPGVMAATAADILLKSSRIIPAAETVLAGSGPLLLLVATHLILAGAPIRALLDTTPFSHYLGSLKHFPRALVAFKDLAKGIQMQQKIRQNGIPIHRNVTHLEALGSDSIEGVRFQSAGRTQEVEAKTLLLHNGLVPDTQISILLDCEHEWYAAQRYWRPVVDKWGNATVDGVGIAGDAAGIAGANAAEMSGYLAGLEAAFSLKKISEQERNLEAKPLQKDLARETHIRPFLDHLYKPAHAFCVPRDSETIVCRCEEVAVDQIRNAMESGLLNPNQVKAQTRCGMGPCQGRMCGLTLSEMVADYAKVDIANVGHLRIRPPLKPISLEQLSRIQLAGQLEDDNAIS